MAKRSRFRPVILGVVVLLLIGVLIFVNLSPSSTVSGPQLSGMASAYEQRWANTQLVDVLTGNLFQISEFKGKTVFVELMAIWCPLCTEQQGELSKLRMTLSDKIVIISIDIDPSERPQDLANYARRRGFAWLWSIDPNGLFNDVFRRSPPETPVIVISPNGDFRVFSGRITMASEFLAHLETFGVRP